MNWNTRNFVSVVHRKGRRYVFSQFTFAFPIIFSLQAFSEANNVCPKVLVMGPLLGCC